MIQAALLLLAAAQASDAAVPGMIEIPAGRTVVGADLKEIKKLIAEKPGSAAYLGAQVPRRKVDVPRFFISPTEVTNEMYLRFVEATGHQPPMSWIQLSREQLQEILRVGKEENGPQWAFEGLEKAKWWDEHWQDEDIKWEMLPETALFPVVAVSHEDAVEYCRWAGVRLPTEEEWTRAARGDDERDFPFGEDFDEKLVAFNATEPRSLSFKLLPVNALPGNASPFGVVDMCGNAWEWTDSGFEAFEGFKSFEVKTKDGEKITVFPPFDASAPVIRGGSYMSPDYGTTIDVRAGIFEVARQDHVGFRVAMDPEPCSTSARYVAPGIETRALGSMASEVLDFARTMGLEKRRFAGDLASSRKAPTEGLPEPEVHESYAVFDGYDTIMVTPLKNLLYPSVAKLARATVDEGPVPVGVLHTTFDLEKPNLPKGSYVLAYVAPLDAKDIVAIGASLPPDLIEEVRATASEEEGDEDSEGPSFAGLEMKPKTDYLLVVGPGNEGKAVIEMRYAPKLETAKKQRHKVILNQDRGRIDFDVAVPDERGRKFYNLRFSLTPIRKDELLSPDAWDGDYFEVIEPQPDAGQ